VVVAIRVHKALLTGFLSLAISPIYLPASIENLYSCVVYDAAGMAGLTDNINDKISLDGYNEHCIVTVEDVEDVKDAVSRRKPGKHDRNLGLPSNHVKHACDEWYSTPRCC
jgi:hypothetical protein